MKLQESNRLPAGSFVLDFGSGVTFFPFAIAQKGLQVICIDNDPVCVRDLERATERLLARARVSSSLMCGNLLPLESGSVQCIYSISVLEHLGEPASIVSELARVLSPSGILVLTIDVDMTGGDNGIGVDRYSRLIKALLCEFEFDMPHAPIHPLALTSRDGRYSITRPLCGWRSVLWEIKQQIVKPILGRKPEALPQLACEGFVLRKRGVDCIEEQTS
jgi:SAM-dependent methyltransferase